MSPFRAQEIDHRLAAFSELSSELRRDRGQCDIVARGIATARAAGIVPAVEYLKAHGVRAQVIERVLLDPARRRALA